MNTKQGFKYKPRYRVLHCISCSCVSGTVYKTSWHGGVRRLHLRYFYPVLPSLIVGLWSICKDAMTTTSFPDLTNSHLDPRTWLLFYSLPLPSFLCCPPLTSNHELISTSSTILLLGFIIRILFPAK